MNIIDTALPIKNIPSLTQILYNLSPNPFIQPLCAIYDLYLENKIKFVILEVKDNYLPLSQINLLISRGIENLASTLQIRGNNAKFDRSQKLEKTVQKCIKHKMYVTDVVFTNRFDDINFTPSPPLKQLLSLIASQSFAYKPFLDHDFPQLDVLEVIKRYKLLTILLGYCTNLESQMQFLSIKMDLKMQPEGVSCEEVILALLLRKVFDFVEQGFEYEVIQ
ncbi:hypothetical protein SS50377_22633 [Spironucleus salmonicida]|uniref:Uncharacterized protein n=1 Tax=Spironucleus salmonicida TaxID=348837 RepID=V6LPW5_9EUKA|nr:hypothetical protein SS50377_22633 [Spironucleus salmonicida]|eukprot:EST46702.1 Hypothetical protein SS50377_13296 [Spironucleus salmonicida]